MSMRAMTGNVGILGTGCYLPERVVTNQELAERWKVTGSSADGFLGDFGIEERRVAAPEEATSDLQIKAALHAIRNAGVEPGDVDLVLTSSLLPDYHTPSNAARVSHQIGAVNALAMEIETACASLIAHMIVASTLIRQGLFKRACCVAGTTWTRVADYTSQDGWLAGDGAAAIVLGQVEADRGILGFHLETHGQHWDAISIMRCPPKGAPDQDPRLLFRVSDDPDALAWLMSTAPRIIPEVVQRAAAHACMGLDEIDYFVPHNPNRDLPRTWAAALGFSDRYRVSVEKYGNMGQSSIGANLHEGIRDGRIRPGDVVAMAAPGAGFYHGAILFRL